MRALPLLVFLAACGGDATDARIRRLIDDVSAKRLERSVRALAGFGTRHIASGEKGIGAAQAWLKKEFEAIAATAKGEMTVHEQSFLPPRSPRVPQPVEIVNVYAVLRGSDPVEAQRVYVVSGHYDSRALDVLDAKSDAPGANDDGSGTAAVLELARVFAQDPPPATLIFLCVSGEEQGLIGSRHFAKKARNDGMRVEGMITNDIVGNSIGRDGRAHRNVVRLFSEGMRQSLLPRKAADATRDLELRIAARTGSESDSPSRQLARFIRGACLRYLPGMEVKLVFRPDRFLRGGDHIGFNEQDYAGVRLTEPFENHDRQHQNVRTVDGREYGDVVDAVDFAYLARVTKVNAAALGALAWGPPKPLDVRLDAKKLENDSTLSWVVPAGGRVRNCEVVWRDTTEPFWRHGRDVGTESAVTLPLSKDNWQFGVRSVDENGRKSPVVYPRPVRR
jgi:hypothetical protein